MFCAFTIKAQANLVLNGSFELNTATLCYEDLYPPTDYNNTINFSSSYGYAIALLKDSCLKCNPLLTGEVGLKKDIGLLH